MDNITFEQLPKAMEMLLKEVSELKELVNLKATAQSTEEKEEFLNIEETAQFLNLTVSTIYTKVSRQELPVIKRGKRLYFSNKDLLKYLKSGRKKSIDEIEEQANAYMSKNKTGLHYGK